ncbi:DNA-binding MarR family transcriptional regulator [Nitrobacteraceae bacterium AZCC 2161]
MRDTIYRLVQALGRLVACREAFGRQLGLTGSQFTVLVGVAYRQGPDGIAIAPLAIHIGLAATHVTTEVGRLVRKGLLIKRPNKVDKRSVLIMLSPKGEAAVRAVTPVVRRINDLLLAGISASELEASSTFANSLLHNSEQALAELKVIETKPSPKRSAPGH